MELKEAIDIIDATLGMVMSFKDEIENGMLKEDFMLTPLEKSTETIFNAYTNNVETVSRYYYTYVDCDTEYKVYMVDIQPVCRYLVNKWPSSKAKKIRSRLKKVYTTCFDECQEMLKYDLSEALDEGSYYNRRYNTGLQDPYLIETLILDTIYEMHHALGVTNEEENQIVIKEDNMATLDDISKIFLLHEYKRKNILNTTKEMVKKLSIINEGLFSSNKNTDESSNPTNSSNDIENPSSFAALVPKPEKADVVLKRLHELVKRKKQPKDITMPIRAAIDAGAISRPTWGEFCKEFEFNTNSTWKSAYSNYTNPNKTPYEDAAFETMKNEFIRLIQ